MSPRNALFHIVGKADPCSGSYDRERTVAKLIRTSRNVQTSD